MENILNIENWIIIGQAMWKMFTFFWPVVLVGTVGMYHVYRSEKEEEELRNEKC
tara:strand:+ start:317 stop:478 length:162 start_codon:yes stop_codon:yes gene_type:complete